MPLDVTLDLRNRLRGMIFLRKLDYNRKVKL